MTSIFVLLQPFGLNNSLGLGSPELICTYSLKEPGDLLSARNVPKACPVWDLRPGSASFVSPGRQEYLW